MIGFIARNKAEKLIGISEKTLRRYDQILTLSIPAYAEARGGARQPITEYQLWCLKKLKQLYSKGLRGSRVYDYLSKNKHLLTIEVFQSENNRFG